MAAIRVQKLELGAVRTILDAELKHAPAAALGGAVVAVGDELELGDVQESILRGHGTLTREVSGALVSTVCGTVERVDQLVTVRAPQTRYVAQVGDVVVGRVVEISGKRWRLDLGSRHEATLLLSAVDLPGGAQRRRTAEDELAMREMFPEGTLLAVEVQGVHADGSLALHARSARYGALGAGVLVTLPAALVRRQARHFLALPSRGVDVVLGCNGAVWVTPATAPPAAGQPPQRGLFGGAAPAAHAAAAAAERPSRDARSGVARVAQALGALGALHMAVDGTSLELALVTADREGVDTQDLQGRAFLTALAQAVVQARVAAAEADVAA